MGTPFTYVLDELEANRNNLKNPYSAGTGSQFSISVNLGEKGTFNNGTCGNISGGYANCFKNTTITVYQDGNRLFTTRTLPLMAGDYTKKEIDSKISALETKINNEATARANADNSLTARLNGKEFVKNRTTSYDLNLRYEKKGSDPEARLHAYNGNTEIPFGSQGSGNPTEGWTQLPSGLIMQWGTVTMTYYYQQFSFNKAFPHRCFEVIISPVGNTVDRSACFFPDTITTTSFYIYGQDANRDGDKRTGTMMWFAIGY